MVQTLKNLWWYAYLLWMQSHVVSSSACCGLLSVCLSFCDFNVSTFFIDTHIYNHTGRCIPWLVYQSYQLSCHDDMQMPKEAAVVNDCLLPAVCDVNRWVKLCARRFNQTMIYINYTRIWIDESVFVRIVCTTPQHTICTSTICTYDPTKGSIGLAVLSY